jgi:hypothetical protein
MKVALKLVLNQETLKNLTEPRSNPPYRLTFTGKPVCQNCSVAV